MGLGRQKPPETKAGSVSGGYINGGGGKKALCEKNLIFFAATSQKRGGGAGAEGPSETPGGDRGLGLFGKGEGGGREGGREILPQVW